MILRLKTKNCLSSVAVLAPSLLLVYIFVYQFIGQTIRMSFSDWNDFGKLLAKQFVGVGFDNYRQLLQDPRFMMDFWNTVFFTTFFIIGCLTVGLFLAVLIDKKRKGSYLFQNLFLFPMALAFVVTGTVWRWIFAPGTPGHPQGINLLLQNFGCLQANWKWFTTLHAWGAFNLALIPLIIAAVWQFGGYVMTMCLAGLRSLDESLLEAAVVDGATEWQSFWFVKFPILRPVILSAVIILGHISLKIFDLVYAMTGSGPNNVTDFPSIYMFETTFKANRYAMGSSIAVLMLLMVMVVIIPYLSHNLKRERP